MSVDDALRRAEREGDPARAELLRRRAGLSPGLGQRVDELLARWTEEEDAWVGAEDDPEPLHGPIEEAFRALGPDAVDLLLADLERPGEAAARVGLLAAAGAIDAAVGARVLALADRGAHAQLFAWAARARPPWLTAAVEAALASQAAVEVTSSLLSGLTHHEPALALPRLEALAVDPHPAWRLAALRILQSYPALLFDRERCLSAIERIADQRAFGAARRAGGVDVDREALRILSSCDRGRADQIRARRSRELRR